MHKHIVQCVGLQGAVRSQRLFLEHCSFAGFLTQVLALWCKVDVLVSSLATSCCRWQMFSACISVHFGRKFRQVWQLCEMCTCPVCHASAARGRKCVVSLQALVGVRSGCAPGHPGVDVLEAGTDRNTGTGVPLDGGRVSSAPDWLDWLQAGFHCLLTTPNFVLVAW